MRTISQRIVTRTPTPRCRRSLCAWRLAPKEYEAHPILRPVGLVISHKCLIEHRCSGKICCPTCGPINVLERKRRRPSPFRCRDCSWYSSVKIDTLMHSFPLAYRRWMLVHFLFGSRPRAISSPHLRKTIGITQKSAWHVLHRIQDNFSGFRAGFSGVVDVAESYIRERFRNFHVAPRRVRRL